MGRPYRIELRLKGLSTATRDGHVRDAVSELIRICKIHILDTMVVENLGWSDETGRDEALQGQVFRHLIGRLPDDDLP